MFEKHRTGKPETKSAQHAREQAAPGGQSSAASGKAAIIGPGIHINGDIHGDENLLVEGHVKGKIHLESHQVDIGQSGRVTADITAKVITISGEVRGDLNGIEKVVISRTGNVHGNIVAPRMTLEDGAIFKGSIDMNPSEPVKAKPAAPVAKTIEKTPDKPAEAPKGTTGDKPKGAGGYSLN